MSKKDQKNIFILAAIGTAAFFLCEFWYCFDWFSVSKIIFNRGTGAYTLRDIIINCDDFLLIGFLFWGIKKATPDIIISKAFCMYMMDLLATCIVYTVLFSPDLETWNRWSLIAISTFVFILQIIWKIRSYIKSACKNALDNN